MPWLVMGALLGLALLSAGLTWAARGYALRQQLVDQPGERRSHSVATPRGGGIAIVISLLVTAGAAMWVWPESTPSLLVASLGLVLVAGIGWWDDHRPLPAMRRLLVHFIAAALLAALVKVHGGSWLLAGLVLVFTASLINIWNFMDGINGIAASQAIVVALGLAPVLPWPYSLAAVALGLACLGFLPFNFPRARIFMGDVGSGALGYAVAVVLAIGVPRGRGLHTGGAHHLRTTLDGTPYPARLPAGGAGRSQPRPGDRDVLCFGPVQYYSA